MNECAKHSVYFKIKDPFTVILKRIFVLDFETPFPVAANLNLVKAKD